MSHSHSSELPHAEPISRFALFVPLAVILAAMIATGYDSIGQLAMISMLFVIPMAILTLRKRSHRS